MRYYKNKFFLYALHSFDDNIEHAHAHTFSLVLFIKDDKKKFVQYGKIESTVNDHLKKFHGTYLNESLGDAVGSATVEEIGEVLFEQLSSLLEKEGFELMRLDVNETPLRTFSVLAKRSASFLLALTIAFLLSFSVTNSAKAATIKIDGKYEDWDRLPHGVLTWGGWNGEDKHRVALFREGNFIYGHIKMHDIHGSQLQINSMYLKVNGITVQFNGLIANKDGAIDWNKTGILYNMPVGTIKEGLSVYTSDYPVTRLGDAAFTVYKADHSVGDDYEFCIDLNVVAKMKNIPVETMKTISLSIPQIGGGEIISSGTSSGPVVGIALCGSLIGIGYLFRKRKSA